MLKILSFIVINTQFGEEWKYYNGKDNNTNTIKYSYCGSCNQVTPTTTVHTRSKSLLFVYIEYRMLREQVNEWKRWASAIV